MLSYAENTSTWYKNEEERRKRSAPSLPARTMCCAQRRIGGSAAQYLRDLRREGRISSLGRALKKKKSSAPKREKEVSREKMNNVQKDRNGASAPSERESKKRERRERKAQ